MKVCVTVVLVLLVHQICAYPVSSREQVTDLLHRTLAQGPCPPDYWCNKLGEQVRNEQEVDARTEHTEMVSEKMKLLHLLALIQASQIAQKQDDRF